MPSDRWLGEVQEITGRGVNAFLGTVEMQGKAAWVNAADRRLAASMQRRAAGSRRRAQRRLGHRAHHPPRQRTTRPRRRACRSGSIPIVRSSWSTESAIARFELPHEFSAAALREAAAFGDKVDPAEVAIAWICATSPLVTIDGDDAKDFDDAVYAERARARLPRCSSPSRM